MECLGEYIYRLGGLRNRTNESSLLISVMPNYLPVGGLTIAIWIKMFYEARIEDQFSAHSTRSTAAYNQFYSGVTLDQIMKQAKRSRVSTFKKSYKNLCIHRNNSCSSGNQKLWSSRFYNNYKIARMKSNLNAAGMQPSYSSNHPLIHPHCNQTNYNIVNLLEKPCSTPLDIRHSSENMIKV